ncbi:uncharacterized protein LOC142984894 isoform X3 [Anticarsia gemmatalis]|uniref:uncharacterized protein LOC142984894 isoform X3 n=1 Tax=Anticarsia gemmatalis TaxID=129554 RepID=UPI003F771B00
MEAIFERLKKEGKNTVDSLIQWLKDAKLVESTKEGEDKARALFNDISDKNNVQFDKFKEVVTKLAEAQTKSFDEFSKKLAEEGPKFIQGALAAIAGAFNK